MYCCPCLALFNFPLCPLPNICPNVDELFHLRLICFCCCHCRDAAGQCKVWPACMRQRHKGIRSPATLWTQNHPKGISESIFNNSVVQSVQIFGFEPHEGIFYNITRNWCLHSGQTLPFSFCCRFLFCFGFLIRFFFFHFYRQKAFQELQCKLSFMWFFWGGGDFMWKPLEMTAQFLCVIFKVDQIVDFFIVYFVAVSFGLLYFQWQLWMIDVCREKEGDI